MFQAESWWSSGRAAILPVPVAADRIPDRMGKTGSMDTMKPAIGSGQ